MALNVISNFAANVAHRNLVKSDMEMTDSLAKLSSGTQTRDRDSPEYDCLQRRMQP